MTLPADYFDGVYADGDDPWGFRDRWYERRKRALTLAALPEARVGRTFEPGCAIGELTAGLAERCDSLLATDLNERALASARERLAGQGHVTFERRTVPGEWPPGEFDLVVLSEVGYYLAGADLALLAERAAGCLTPGGALIACHWRHPVADYPTSGDAVHAALAATGLPRIVRHEEEDLLLEVFSPAGQSVARRGGLL